MKILVAVAFCLLAFFTVASLFFVRSAREVQSSTALAATAVLDDPLLAELEALEEENHALRARLERLEQRPTVVARESVVDAYVTKEDFDAFREEVRAALAERNATGKPRMAPAELKEQISDALLDLRKEEAVQKYRAYQEKRTTQLDEALPKIQEWLGLSTHQSYEMREALQRQYDREADLLRRWEEGEDPEVLGEQKAADREAHRAELGEFLTGEQLETYLTGGKSGDADD